MAAMTDGIELSAINVLKRAISHEEAKQYNEALVCYQEGIDLLLQVLKATHSEVKKQHFRKKAEEYMKRAEELKKVIKTEKEINEEIKIHEVIQIEEDSTGNSYGHIFNHLLDPTLTKVEVDDPYIRSIHQIYNFLRFCELLCKSKAKVKTILLNTGQDDMESERTRQIQALTQIQSSLEQYNINLVVNFNKAHDREIRFNNGWIIKIGRGLDYFKATPSKYSVGFCDYDLRKCYQTTVNIFNTKYTSQKKMAT